MPCVAAIFALCYLFTVSLSVRADVPVPVGAGADAGNAAPATPPAPHKPNLYILAIGVGDYFNAGVPKLDYAAKDATDFVSAMKAQKGSLYGDVVTKVITDQAATRQAVLQGLDWMEKQPTQYDVAMIFLSGRGLADNKGNYYFGCSEIDPADVRSTGVRETEFAETIHVLPCKALVFMDAGQPLKPSDADANKDVPLSGIDQDLQNTPNGTVLFLSASGAQPSVESDQWKNGAFTKALVEGIKGKAANPSGYVTWGSLSVYVTSRVKDLTHGVQVPAIITSGVVPDFIIAIAPATNP
jgi:uncharacterized caspase-like protein